MKKYTIMFHKADMDGICSATIVYKYLYTHQLVSNDDEILFVPWNYGFKIPEEIKDTIVYAVDLGMRFDDLKTVQELSKDFFWIDHHYTAIKEYEERKGELNKEIKGLRSKEYAACSLCYQYLFECVKDEHIPYTVKLLSDYDIWDKEDEHFWETVVMPYQMYVKTYCMPNIDNIPEAYNILKDSQENIFEVIELGKAMYDYQKAMWKTYSYYAKLKEFMGWNVLYINSNQRSSHQVMGSKLLPEADIICVYTHNNGKWEYSFYHDKNNPEVNCGEIARTFGGGGHKNAAGFETDFFIFE